MYRSILHKVFVFALALALVGGVVFVLWQALGLALGSAAILTAPNNVLKTVLCIAASVASIAAYLLLHVGSTPREYAEENQSK